MNKNEIINILLTPKKFLQERPAMSAFQEVEVQEAIFASFNLINGECANLPMQVWTYMYPAYQEPPTPVDETNDLYRTPFEIDQFLQAVITQTQYTLNMGNDFSQGSSTFSTGGVSATIQRPEKRDILAPGVLLFLQNARLYKMQQFTTKLQKPTNSCDVLSNFLTTDKGDLRYVAKYQADAKQGSIATINANKMVTFEDPANIPFRIKEADRILDTDGQYKSIKEINNLAFFGNDGTSAATRQFVQQAIDAGKTYDPNWTYRRGDLIVTFDQNKGFFDYWMSNHDNNLGHDPKLDNTNFYWWTKLFNTETKAKYIFDPTDNTYKLINSFSAEYFGGLTAEQIYSAINASGTVFNPDLIYRKDFVVIFVNSANSLDWYKSKQDNNIGHNPETDTDWWEKLPQQAIDVNSVMNQLQPYINSAVEQEVQKEINKAKTALNTDYKGSIYEFENEQAFNQFIQDNPKLSADMFDDIPTDYYTKTESDNKYAIKNQTNNFTETNQFKTVFVGGNNNQNRIYIDRFDYSNNNICSIKFVKGQGKNLLQIDSNNNTEGVLINGQNARSFRIAGLSSPTENADATNKQYVDGLIAPIRQKLDNESFIDYTGEWISTKTYVKSDSVTVGDRWYVSKKDNNRNHQPSTGGDSEWWALINSPNVNLNDYYTKAEADNKFAQRGDISNLQGQINDINTLIETVRKQTINAMHPVGSTVMTADGSVHGLVQQFPSKFTELTDTDIAYLAIGNRSSNSNTRVIQRSNLPNIDFKFDIYGGYLQGPNQWLPDVYGNTNTYVDKSYPAGSRDISGRTDGRTYQRSTVGWRINPGSQDAINIAPKTLKIRIWKVIGRIYD